MTPRTSHAVTCQHNAFRIFGALNDRHVYGYPVKRSELGIETSDHLKLTRVR